MKIKLIVEEIESAEEEFLVNKIRAYIDLVVDRPELILKNGHILGIKHEREIVIVEHEK